MDPFCMI